MVTKIKLFTSSKLKNCPACNMVKQLLSNQSLEYEEIDVVTNREERRRMFKKTHSFAVPILEIGDDFFIGARNKNFEELFELTNNVLKEFKDSVKNLYSNSDKKNGYIITKDRFDQKRKFNLLSTSCAIIEVSKNSKIQNFDHTISLLKKHSKKYPFPLCASI